MISKHLREASIITERHKAKMPTEHARSLFKLAEALSKDPRESSESVALRKESALLLATRHPQVTLTDDEKIFDDLVFIWWR